MTRGWVSCPLTGQGGEGLNLLCGLCSPALGLAGLGGGCHKLSLNFIPIRRQMAPA